MTAMERNYGTGLKYSSDNSKNNQDIVVVSVKQNGRALKYVSDFLKNNNQEIVMVDVKQNDLA